MNQQLSLAELALISSPIPMPPPLPAMTRKEKLLRFAWIVRNHGEKFVIFHGIEYEPQQALDQIYHPQSAFAAAGRDPVLQQAGLKADLPGDNVSIGGAQRFFELSQHDLHEFSCDCGGVISNEEMARRIESIAARS
jgi:hypothetical protein